jgi:hypothetical protein
MFIISRAGSLSTPAGRFLTGFLPVLLAERARAKDVRLRTWIARSPGSGRTGTAQPERGVMMTMPGGWKMGQGQAQQRPTTCAEFTREILNETARCLSIPYDVAARNLPGWNCTSGWTGVLAILAQKQCCRPMPERRCTHRLGH